MKAALLKAVFLTLFSLVAMQACTPTEHPVAINGYQEPLIRDVGDRVFFPHQDADLTEQASETLDRLVVFLETYPGDRVTFEGHAHDFDNPEENDLISERRAENVLRYLIEQGIDPSRLSTIAYGYRRPVVLGDSGKARAQNRRVQFVLETE